MVEIDILSSQENRIRKNEIVKLNFLEAFSGKLCRTS